MKYLKIISIVSLLCSNVLLQGLQFTEEGLKNHIEENKDALVVGRTQNVASIVYRLYIPNYDENILCTKSVGANMSCIYYDRSNFVLPISDDFYYLLRNMYESTGSGKGTTKRVKSE